MGSGERLNGIQEVSGSIPLISTKKDLKSCDFGSFFAFGPFGDGWMLRPGAGRLCVGFCEKLIKNTPLASLSGTWDNGFIQVQRRGLLHEAE